MSAAPGTGTAIPARASIRRAIPTAIRSRRSCWRNGTGPSISPASRKRCAISTMSPTSSTCAATSSSRAGSRPRSTTRRREAGPSRWRTAASFNSRFLITAIGPLSTPTLPRIEGRDDFKGQSFHTARWPKEPVDFAGKRVAVIGTGATGVQTIQTIAGQVGHLTVFQRTRELVRAAAQRQDRRRDAEADQGRLSRDVRALPGDLCLLPAHAGPARRVRGVRRGARGVLRKALWRARLRHLAGQFQGHPDRPQGQRDDLRFRGAKDPRAGEESRRWPRS